MKKDSQSSWLAVFPSSLGWIALLGGDKLIKELTFGHATGRAAKKALTPAFPARARPLGNKTPLMRRLQAYAQGIETIFAISKSI